MEDDSHLNESPGHPIQYNQLNEQFGDLSSDEEDDIDQTLQQKKVKTSNKTYNEFLLTHKNLSQKTSHYYFPNYFESYKLRAKVTEAEETRGKNEILQGDFNKNQQMKQKENQKKLKEASKKKYFTDAEDTLGQASDYEEILKSGVMGQEAQSLIHHKNEEELQRMEENDLTRKHLSQKRKHYAQVSSSANFTQMKYYLECGFNLLVYGVGSKRNLVNQFVQSYLSEDPKLIVNGFHSGVSIKSITNPMVKFVMKLFQIKIGSHVHDQIEELKRIFNNISNQNDKFSKYYIVIHSMDAGPLKNPEWQKYLSELANVRGISMIVTVDHFKSGIMWSDMLLDRFNFYSFQLDTFEDYDTELEYQAPLFSTKNDNQEVGLWFVLQSMTSAQKQVIKTIAKYQLDNPNEPGVTMKALMAVCVENMVAYSQKMIKDYLNEAMDHKVVLEKHDNDGHSFLYMNYPIQTLEKMANDEFK
eukprot:403359737